MAYGGYLIKVGNYESPFKFIEASSYKTGIKGQDLDSYNDANGILQRTALENVSVKTEWETPAPITESETRELMDNIRSQYSNSTEKKAIVTCWSPELGQYVSMNCYMPDVDYTVQFADNKEIIYDKYRLAFIGYGGKV